MCKVLSYFCYHLYTDCFSVADYRVKQLTGNDKSKEEPLKVNKTSFSEIFHLVFDKSVNNVHQSQFRRLSFSIHGKGIVQICEILLENSSLKAQLSSILEPAFLAVLNSNAADGCSLKETLFSKFYEMTLQSANEIIIALKDKIDPVLPLRQFAGVLLRQVMEDIIDERSSIYKKDIEKAQNEISEADQSVLFYISGYIIHAVEKSQKRLKHSSQSMQDSISLLLKNEHDSKKTFIEKYSKWTERVNRGGLKIPSDNFFLLIREFEFVCRKSVGEEALNSLTFCKTNVKELIMEEFMVKYYLEQLKMDINSQLCERIMSLFLTIRGNACARKRKLEEINTGKTKTKSVRQSLKEISSNK